MNEVQILIDRLKELKAENSSESYTHIKNILSHQILPIPLATYKPLRLIRTRSHRKGEIFFEKIDDLTFRKDILNINHFGRANEPGQGFFYCNDNLNEGTGFSESMNVFRNNPDSRNEIITIGAWDVTRELNLAVVLPSEYKEVDNSLLNWAKESYNVLNDGSSNFKQLKIMLEFIANEFTLDKEKDSSNYKITCAFVNYIKDNFPSLDGVVYASVKSALKGENIVLWKEVAEDCLKLIGARKRTFELMGNKNFVETEYCDTEQIDYEKGIIKWKKPVANIGYK
ncbi:hypothetical protein [Namhaeicola litoreus]|uniref:RES domain-containing protein n=1 Tax=Namhaeicola litoreus TaxID=1052145 RepID=A0ABW3Y0E3_9FLAO